MGELARREAEIGSMRDRIARLERERNEQAAGAEAARLTLRERDKQCDALQVEVASLSKRLDVERMEWLRDTEEARKEEEARRDAIVAQIQEEHKKQLVKLQASSKRSLQEAAHKRQELRQQRQDLVRRIRQVQEEKAVAVRVCEENKNAYELQLVGAGLASRCGSAAHRRELRSITERLEANAERFRSCQSSVDL